MGECACPILEPKKGFSEGMSLEMNLPFIRSFIHLSIHSPIKFLLSANSVRPHLGMALGRLF